MHRTLLCSLPVSSARDHRRMPFRAAAGALSPRKCKYSSPILPLCSALSVSLSQDVHAMLVHAMLAHAMLTHTFTSPRRGTSPRHLAAAPRRVAASSASRPSSRLPPAASWSRRALVPHRQLLRQLHQGEPLLVVKMADRRARGGRRRRPRVTPSAACGAFRRVAPSAAWRRVDSAASPPLLQSARA